MNHRFHGFHTACSCSVRSRSYVCNLTSCLSPHFCFAKRCRAPVATWGLTASAVAEAARLSIAPRLIGIRRTDSTWSQRDGACCREFPCTLATTRPACKQGPRKKCGLSPFGRLSSETVEAQELSHFGQKSLVGFTSILSSRRSHPRISRFFWLQSWTHPCSQHIAEKICLRKIEV